MGGDYDYNRRRGCCVSELGDKEVINISDGRRLGCVTDVEVDIRDGRLLAIIIDNGLKLFGPRKEKSIVIGWDCIERIGDDIILVKYVYPVDIRCEKEEGPKRKRFFF